MTTTTPSYHQAVGDDDAYARGLEEKVARVRTAFARALANGARVEVVPSDAREFRSRCRFQLVRDADGGLRHALWDGGGPTRAVDDFEMAVGGIRRAMRAVPRAVSVGGLDAGLEAAHYLSSAAREDQPVLVTLVRPVSASIVTAISVVPFGSRCRLSSALTRISSKSL